MTDPAENRRGALLMMGSMAAFTLNDTCLKAVTATLPLAQTLVLRGLIASALLALLAWRRGALTVTLSRRDKGLVALRSLAEVGAAWFFLTALTQMPLANVTALLQTLPLTVTLAAALVFGEPVGWRRWTAIAVGFVGMLLIVKPGTEGFSLYSLYALVAVVFVTIRDLAARKLSREVPSLAVTLVASLAVTVFFGATAAAQGWAPMTRGELSLILASGLLISGAYLLSVMVMRVGEIAVVAPFRYTGLVWALLLGWLAFDEWPVPSTLAGAGLIAATGMFTLWRSARVRRRR
ncbi:DMT family transporter [Litorisediminicola beolgyonensis]|uniref:DMT family transporter n=1 Tax=Litorisediminicola beolgyonensis TaxID=1173614 RepID=A0ABW3ZKV7_9RHOB